MIFANEIAKARRFQDLTGLRLKSADQQHDVSFLTLIPNGMQSAFAGSIDEGHSTQA